MTVTAERMDESALRARRVELLTGYDEGDLRDRGERWELDARELATLNDVEEVDFLLGAFTADQ